MAASILLRLAFLEASLGPRIPYVTLFPAVMLAAVAGGLAGGLLATAISAAVATLWFQGGKLDEGEWLALIMFLATGALMSAVGGAVLRVKERLGKSEERFRIAAEAANDAVYEWDLKDRVEWFGDVDGLLGYAPGEFPRTLAGWFAAVHPGDLAEVRAAIEAHLEGRAKYLMEYRMLRKDGTVRWWSANGVARRRPDGAPYFWVGTITDVTARKEAEEALRESESRFRQLAETMPQLVWTCEPGGLCDYLNRQWHDYTGAPEASLRGFGWLGWVHPDDRAPAVAAWQAAVAAGTDFRTEFRLRRHDDEYRWFDTRAVPLRDASGRIVKWYGTNTDFTERRAGEEFVRDMFDHSESLVYVTDNDGRFLFCNRALQRVLGRTREEIVGRTRTDLLPKEVAEAHRKNDLEVISGRQSVSMHEENEQTDGRHLYSSVKFPLFDAKGQVYAIAGISTDVTKREADAASLRSSEGELRILWQAVEQTPATVIITDLEGRIEYVNPKFAEVTGYSKEEVRGQNPRILKSGLTPEEVYRDLWATLAAGGVWRGELCNRRKDGELFWEVATISPVRGPDGRVAHYVAVKEDVTAGKRAAEELGKTREQLQQAQKMEAVGRLAGGVAHDFNNLLTVMQGYGEMLQTSLAEDSADLESADEIVRAAGRAAALTKQLLAFSRQQVLEMKVLDLREVVAEAEKMLKRLIGEDVEVVFDSPPALGRVKADPGQVVQVLLNLTVNARDAMPRGGRLTVALADATLDADLVALPDTIPKGRYVVLSVADTGIGMDAETIGRIFEPFFTMKEKGKGTGLGLSTVYGIAHQLGGMVAVESAPGAGSTFRISLPRCDEQPTSGAQPRSAVRSLRGTETILVAEDEEGVRQLVGAVLKRHGYSVLAAESGAAALEILASNPGRIDLLLTDLVMPGMRGADLASAVQASRPGVRVVFMSGYAGGSVAGPVLGSADFFLAKPFTERALAAKVREALDTLQG